MNAETIQSLCIAGAQAYLDFLIENDRGRAEIRVIQTKRVEQLEKPVYKLILADRLFDSDGISLELEPPGCSYGPEYFKVVEYDSDARVLIIQVENTDLPLDADSTQRVRIISDLKFLVSNVKRWFEANGKSLQLTRHNLRACIPIPPNGMSNIAIGLDQYQRDAISSSLKNPLVYVWGPPGTGKTTHVLAEACLQFILAQKRVGIFAPTNNALEQAMAAILNLSASADIGKDRFLRVGHPSAKFAEQFPMVCEVQGLQRRIKELEEQIQIYETVLHCRRGATVLDSTTVLRDEIGRLLSHLDKRRRIYEARAQLRRNPVSRVVHLLDGKLRVLDQERVDLEKTINGQLELIRLTQTESPALDDIIRRIDFTSIEQAESNVAKLEDKIREYTEINRAVVSAYEDQPSEDIQRLKHDLEDQVGMLKRQTVRERIKDAFVTGMTLDCFIGRFYDISLPFDQVFVDEAGYAPLVKALTLCRGGVPVTLIGDHKQLGPVCEMNDENLVTPDNRPAIMWKKPSLFLKEFFEADNETEGIENLFRMSEPSLCPPERVTLGKTFRFGQNVADILSDCVYHDIRLVAAGDQQDLKVTSLDAIPNQEPELRRQNRSEAEAIAAFLREHGELNNDAEETFGILTPYKNQVTLLCEILVQARRQGRIMTVHKSQGREWDTVILSVVDGRSSHPWFTDSTNLRSDGMRVMNTAVSRARKHLVLVCDRDYWLKLGREQQIISRLLRAEDTANGRIQP